VPYSISVMMYIVVQFTEATITSLCTFVLTSAMCGRCSLSSDEDEDDDDDVYERISGQFVSGSSSFLHVCWIIKTAVAFILSLP